MSNVQLQPSDRTSTLRDGCLLSLCALTACPYARVQHTHRVAAHHTARMHDLTNCRCTSRSTHRRHSPPLNNVSFFHSFTPSFILEFTHSLNSFSNSFIHSFIQPLTHELTYSFTHSFIQPLTHSLNHSLIHSATHSLTYHLPLRRRTSPHALPLNVTVRGDQTDACRPHYTFDIPVIAIAQPVSCVGVSSACATVSPVCMVV